MKTILSKLNNEQAKKEVKQFSIAALACGAASLLIFWWLGIAAVAFGARALLLTKHTGNKDNPKLSQYRLMAVAAIVIGIVSLIAV